MGDPKETGISIRPNARDCRTIRLLAAMHQVSMNEYLLDLVLPLVHAEEERMFLDLTNSPSKIA